jgi:DNA primase
MSIPKSFIEDLKSRSRIEQIIAEHVRLKQAGRNMTGLCPFHSERTPSFNVNVSEQYYHCFGCGAGGDVITFVMNYERLEYIETIKYLAERAGLTVPETDGSGNDERIARLKTRILAANREAARFFHSQFQTSPAAEKGRRYLAERGLSPGIITKFGLGYAVNDWDTLKRRLTEQGFTEDELQAARLLGGKGYDFFRDRVMFPILDLRGNVIGFGGRTVDGDGPKYINTPENPVFHKGRNLFSLQFAKKALSTGGGNGGRSGVSGSGSGGSSGRNVGRNDGASGGNGVAGGGNGSWSGGADGGSGGAGGGNRGGNGDTGIRDTSISDNFILCEGYMDVIALYRAGFMNAVATLGTALTPEQARLMASYVKNVFISYDADEAGRKAAGKAINLLSDAGLRTKIIEIPDAKDPDEYIAKFGADKFRLILKKAGDATDFRLSKAADGLDLAEPGDRVQYLDNAAKIIAEYPERHRIVYTSELAEKLRLPPEQVRSVVNGYVKRGERAKETEQWQNIERAVLQTDAGRTKFQRAETHILAYVYKNPDGVRYLCEHLTNSDLSDEVHIRVYNLFKESLDKNIEFDLLRECDLADQGKITEIMEIANTITITNAEFVNSIELIKHKPKPAAELTDDDLRNLYKL